MKTAKSQQVVDRLFERFALRWARLFLNEYEGLDINKVKEEWSKELERFDVEQVTHGFEACKFSQYPPSLPTFIQHCKAAPCRVPVRMERKFTDEEIKRNRDRLKSILDMLTKGKLVPEEAE